MCQPTVFWHNCNHLIYTAVSCPDKPSPSAARTGAAHPVHPPTTTMQSSPCFLCTAPETESIARLKRNQLTARQLEGILDGDLSAAGFTDMVARFYARGAHKRFAQIGPEHVDEQLQAMDEVAIDNADKNMRAFHSMYGNATLPVSRWIANLIPGYAFDLVLDDLAEDDSDPSVLNRNGCSAMADLDPGPFWGDDDNEALLDTFNSSSSVKLPPSSSAGPVQRSPSKLAYPARMSRPSSMPTGGQTVDAPRAGHSRQQSSPAQMIATTVDPQERYPSPIPLASPAPDPTLTSDQHSIPISAAATSHFGHPNHPAQMMQPGTATPAPNNRSPTASSGGPQPTTTQQNAPASLPMSITFDMKRFKTQSKPKPKPKPKKTIRVITDPPKEEAPPPSAIPAAAAQTPASAPGDMLHNYPVQDMMLQCQKLREAAGRRRVEEIKESKGSSGSRQKGVLGVQGENVRVHK